MNQTDDNPKGCVAWILAFLISPFVAVALLAIIAGVVCVFPFAFVFVLISETIKGRRDRVRRSRALKTTLILPNE